MRTYKVWATIEVYDEEEDEYFNTDDDIELGSFDDDYEKAKDFLNSLEVYTG